MGLLWGAVLVVTGLALIWYQPKLTGKTHVEVPQPAFRRGVALLVGMNGLAAVAGGATTVGVAMVVFAATFVGVGEAMAARSTRSADGPALDPRPFRGGVVFGIGGGLIALVGLLLIVGAIHAV